MRKVVVTFSSESVGEILESKTKKRINIWAKSLVAAVLKGSLDAW
jgi:hypothetical protein